MMNAPCDESAIAVWLRGGRFDNSVTQGHARSIEGWGDGLPLLPHHATLYVSRKNMLASNPMVG